MHMIVETYVKKHSYNIQIYTGCFIPLSKRDWGILREREILSVYALELYASRKRERVVTFLELQKERNGNFKKL